MTVYLLNKAILIILAIEINRIWYKLCWNYYFEQVLTMMVSLLLSVSPHIFI